MFLIAHIIRVVRLTYVKASKIGLVPYMDSVRPNMPRSAGDGDTVYDVSEI